MTEIFGGATKHGESLLLRAETKFKKWAVPKIPQKIETYHLTMLSLVWAMLNVLTGFFAENNLEWLWAVSLLIVLQYLTDLFDGELGRQRNTGLVKWGFYMDHFLDYLFLCSLVFVGYMICPVNLQIWYMGLLVVLGGFMLNSFLSFAATNKFEIYHLGVGPTEGRLAVIAVNTFIIFRGTEDFHLLLPLTVLFLSLALVVHSWSIHKTLWKLDMEATSTSK